MWHNAPVNAEIIKFIQSFSSPFLDSFFQLVTMMGEEYFYTVVLLVIFWCIDKKFGYRIGLAFLSGSVANIGIKEALRVPRPIGEIGIRSLRVETATGYSFPSGHTQNITTFWASIMIYVRKRWVYAIGILLILMVGLSRLYLGVHRPVDVLGGITIGTVWVLISNSMYNYTEETGRKTIFLIFIIPMMILLFVFPTGDYYKMTGMTLGFYIGYIIEPKYIGFDVRSSLTGQIIKLVSGIAVLMAIRAVVKLILPQSLLSDFIRYFLIAVWVTLGAPYLFKRYFTRIQKTTGESLFTGRP